MHAATVVEEYGLIVISATTHNTERQTARADNLIGGKVKDCHVVLTDNQQLSVVVHALQVEWLVNTLQSNDLRHFSVNDDQVAGTADGKALSILGNEHVAETVMPIAQQAVCYDPAALGVVGEYLAVSADRQQFSAVRQNVDTGNASVMAVPTATAACRLGQRLENRWGIEVTTIVVRVKVRGVGQHIAKLGFAGLIDGKRLRTEGTSQ